MKSYILGLMVIIGSQVVLTQSGLAQSPCDDDQADLPVRIVGRTDTIPRWKVCPYFNFVMAYDNLCQIQYMITECKKNGGKIRLSNYSFHQEIRDWESGQLSDSSHTVNFTVVTGDTISFYRRFLWFNPVTHSGDYFADDTLNYAVELVALDGSRLALLDTIGANKRSTPGQPVLFGNYPVRRVVKYIIPSSINNTTAFLRIRVYSRGNGAYYFTRFSGRSTALSDELGNTLIQQELTTVNTYFIE